jgi:tetratricopeptide (TPR) repeat protein
LNADHDSTDAAPAAGKGAIGRQRTTAASRMEGLSPIAMRYLQQAARELDQGRIDHSARALQAVAALDPHHPEVLRLQALLAARRGEPRLALTPLQRALAQWPDDAAILGNLGSVLVALGDGETAVRVFTRVSEVAPDQAGSWFNLGLALEAQAQHDAAGVALRRALELAPNHPGARIAHAANLATIGEIGAATAAYRAAIAVAPTSVQAWLGLVNLKTSRLDEAELAALERLYASPALDVNARASTGFAFGKALEDHGRHEEAYAVFHQANAAKRRQAPWDAQGFSRGVDAVMAAFMRVTPAPAMDMRGSEVIFVVGMPRSGSTLVEQILSAHGEVEGASELPDLDAVLREESQRRRQPLTAWAGEAMPDDWQRLGERYLERTARWRVERPRHTDKMPDNWLIAGAALAMLPGARVVDCERDALETAWSCYKQWFGAGRHLYAYDLADIAAQMRDHARLVAFWCAKFPGRVRVQSHDALIADPEPEVRALLDFCGLPYDPACLRFHEARRAVRSASAAQVRQPMFDSARAKAYGDLLAPLRRLLQADESASAAATQPPPVPSAPPAAQTQRLAGLPADARRALAMAEAALAHGRGDAVAPVIESVRNAHPDHVEPMRILAMLQASRGHHEEATALLRSALVHEPGDALLYNTLGVLQADRGDQDAARENFERAFALDPRSAASENLAKMRLDAGDPAGARTTYADALARAPDLLPARLRLAGLLRDAGELVAAAREWRTCLGQDPHCAPAWCDLVDLADGALGGGELEALLAALRQPALAHDARAQLSLACGRALESRGRPREGYAMIAAAGAWRARSSEWDGTRFAQRCDEIVRAFDAYSVRAMDPRLGSEIVFIVDTPRAGADLDAALGAHADIAAGGELPLLAELVSEESRKRGMAFPGWIADASAADWQRLGEIYLQRSARLRLAKSHSTDRSPALPTLLGAAAAMLPGARFIDCRHEPLEACWSWFREGREPFAADLVDLSDYWRARSRLMQGWRARLGARMLPFDGELRGARRADALRGLLEQAGFAHDQASFDAPATRDASRAAIDAREAGLRHEVRARDLGSLLHPLQRLLDADDAVSATLGAAAAQA